MTEQPIVFPKSEAAKREQRIPEGEGVRTEIIAGVDGVVQPFHHQLVAFRLEIIQPAGAIGIGDQFAVQPAEMEAIIGLIELFLDVFRKKYRLCGLCGEGEWLCFRIGQNFRDDLGENRIDLDWDAFRLAFGGMKDEPGWEKGP